MLARMRAEVFAGWRRFFQLEPWGCEQDDLRAGVVASTLANIYRDKKRKPEPFTAYDFARREQHSESLPTVPGRQKTPGELMRAVEAISLAFGGQDKRKQRPRYRE